MKKVYFETESKKWTLDDLDEMYSFKYVNIMTNEESEAVLTWIKQQDNSELGIGEEDRLYGADLFGEEYLFVEYYEEGRFYLRAKDSMHLESLCRDHDLVFVGETRK